MEFRRIIRNQIEYRFEPLTNEQCRINPQRAKRVKQAESARSHPENRADIPLSAVIQKSREGCVFCPQLIEEKTPKFPPQISVDGRIRGGESIIFPNLNPFGENHAVGIITTEHFVPMDEFSPEVIADNLLLSADYIRSVYRNNSEAIFPIYVWNYMPPSAGSIIHPHVQLMVESEPVPQQKTLIKNSLSYFQNHKRNYWNDLIEAERKQGDRFIFENDSLSLIASFAPRGFNEVHFIFHGVSCFSHLNEKQIDDFALCLTKVLRGYKAMGIGSFNLATYSGANTESLDYYCFNAKIISRPFPRGVYTNDTGPMERLYNVWVIDTLPEQVAQRIRPFFNGR